MPKNPTYLYVQSDKVLLMTHHIKSGMITRIRKGHNTVYDIKETDIGSPYVRYLEVAKKKNLPVVLQVVNITRLLIFNKDDKN